MKPIKTVYYSDSLNDDFANNGIKTKHVGSEMKYIHRNKLWRLCAFILYYAIALPIVYLFAKIHYGLRIKGRRNLRKAGKNGYFLYGNHTQYVDSVIPAIIAAPRKAYLIADADAVSIPGIKNIVMMLGAIPVPDTLSGMKHFVGTIEMRIRQKRVVAIYPEAHIWPYYTGVRPFISTSFKYPLKCNVPSFAMVMTYRETKKNKPPKVTITISPPFYPNRDLSLKAAEQDLRDRVYQFMKTRTEDVKNAEYIHYEYRPKDEKNASL